jgi:hypothetical protein
MYYFEGTVASDLYKLEEARIERKAALNWRTRHMKSREAQVLSAALTSILHLFVR